MPIPSAQMLHVEIHVHGLVAAGGSNSKFTENIFHFTRQNPALPLSTKAQIDTAFQAQVVVPLGALLNARWLQQRNSIRYIDDAQDGLVDFSHAVVGAIAGDSMSTALAAYTLWRTGLRGKSYKGSKHYFPLSESDTTAGSDDILNAGAIARYATLNGNILAGFTDAGGNTYLPCVVSKLLSQLLVNPTNVVANTVTQIALNKRLGTMTKRKAQSDY